MKPSVWAAHAARYKRDDGTPHHAPVPRPKSEACKLLASSKRRRARKVALDWKRAKEEQLRNDEFIARQTGPATAKQLSYLRDLRRHAIDAGRDVSWLPAKPSELTVATAGQAIAIMLSMASGAVDADSD